MGYHSQFGIAGVSDIRDVCTHRFGFSHGLALGAQEKDLEQVRRLESLLAYNMIHRIAAADGGSWKSHISTSIH